MRRFPFERLALCATATITAAAFGAAVWAWRLPHHLGDWQQEARR